MPAHTLTPSVVLDRVSFAWPDGSPALDGRLRRLRRRPHRTRRPQRLGQVHAAAPHRRRARRPSAGHITTIGGCRVPAAAADARRRSPRRRAARRRPRRSARCAPSSPATSTRATSTRSAPTGTSRRARTPRSPRRASRPTCSTARVGELSGGEAVLTAIAGIRLRAAPIALLDEPTNNLDRDARARLADMVRGWRGTLIVVSHDVVAARADGRHRRAVRERAVGVRRPVLRSGGRGSTPSRMPRGRPRRRPRRSSGARSASASRPRRRSRTRQAMGRKAQFEKRVPPIVAGNRKRAAQVSAGKLRTEKARSRGGRARGARCRRAPRARRRHGAHRPARSRGARRAPHRDDRRRRALVGHPGPGARRADRPERRRQDDAARAAGRIGAGRSQLGWRRGVRRTPESAARAADGADSSLRSVRAELHTDRVGYLPQRVDGLDEAASVLENVAGARHPRCPIAELRNRLARFLIRGAAVDRPVATLSGGERFRVALARLLLADPPPQLIVLDEPTNNLDLDTVDQLVDALARLPRRGARGEPRRRVPRAARRSTSTARARSQRRRGAGVTERPRSTRRLRVARACASRGQDGRMAANSSAPAAVASIGGVCVAIANRFEMSARVVRALMVARCVFFGLSIWLYLILWLLIPLDAADRATGRGSHRAPVIAEQPRRSDDVQALGRRMPEHADRGRCRPPMSYQRRWRDERRARAVRSCHAGLVPRRVPAPDGRAGRRVGGDLARQARPRRRSDRLGQDAVGVPLGDRPRLPREGCDAAPPPPARGDGRRMPRHPPPASSTSRRSRRWASTSSATCARRSSASGSRRGASASRCPRSRSACAPATRPRATAASSSPLRPTSSSRRPSRST